MKTLYLGPDEILIAAKLAFDSASRFADIAGAINNVETRIRAAIPRVRTVIYIEPDVYVDPSLANPPTDAIVIKGLE
jgi:divalent metal cation (Fe/Co/Zn/Cd) transporter